MAGRSYVQVQQEVYSPFSLPKLPLVFLLVIYARQSAKDAPIRNKESYDMQTVELVEYGRELGWLDDTMTRSSSRLRISVRMASGGPPVALCASISERGCNRSYG